MSRRWTTGATLPIRYSLRNGLVLWVMAAVLGVELGVAFMRGAPWRGDIIWTTDWLAVSFVLVAPLVAGLAAVDTARNSVGASHLYGRRFWRTPAFAVASAHAVGVGLTHVAVFVAMFVYSMVPSFAAHAPLVVDRFTPLAVLVQVLILWLFVAIGSLAGRFLAPVVGGISAALVSLALVYALGTPGSRMAVLDTGNETIPRIGYVYSATFLGAQALLLGLLIVAALVLRPRDTQRSLRPYWPGSVVAGVLTVGVFVGTVFAPAARLDSTDAAPDFCGGVESVPVCFYAQHAHVMAEYQDGLWALVQAARDHGYGDLVPGRIVEASRTVVPTGPGVGALFVMPEHLSGSKPTTWELVLGLVQPLQCPQLRGDEPPSQSYWDDLTRLTATWAMLVQPSAGEENGFFGKPLPPAQAAQLLDEFQTCTYPF